jgi:hypothetical protein
VEHALDREQLIELLENHALARDTMDAAQVRAIREEMERAEARRLQPHFIAAFFLHAFRLLGGRVSEREAKRYEVGYVPTTVRAQERALGARHTILQRYERITFEKERRALPGVPTADFVCPDHPLLDATIAVVLERYRDLLTRGAVLVAPEDTSEMPRVLFTIEHAIQDARTDRSGRRHIVSRQMQFVELDAHGATRMAGYAPYLDYRPPTPEEQALIAPTLNEAWLTRDLAKAATKFAIADLVPRHYEEVRRRKEELIDKTTAAVKERLTKEIIYWDRRATELELQERAGKTPRLNSARARQRRDELQGRLDRRMDELAQERKLAPLPPVVLGGALIIPGGLLARLSGSREAAPTAFARETRRVELEAMAAVAAAERALGYEPRDVSAEKVGYDIESRIPGTGKLRFIEVKGRVRGADTVTVTKNEILTALNKPRLDVLMRSYRQGMVRKAQALKVAVDRGLQPPLN